MAVNSFNAQNPPVTTKGDVFTFSTIPTRLGVGANNTVLTADSTTATGLKWATPSSGGGFTLLATATLSATGTFTFSSISADYTHLFISVIDLVGSANDAEYKMQFNQATGNHSSSNLYYNGTSTVTASQRGQDSFGAGGVGSCPIQRMYTSAGDFGDITARSSIWVWNYSSASLEKQVSWVAGGNARFTVGQGVWSSTSAITRIDFIPYAATTATGTVLLYGVK